MVSRKRTISPAVILGALAISLMTPHVRAQTRPATAPAMFTLNFKDAPLDAVLAIK